MGKHRRMGQGMGQRQAMVVAPKQKDKHSSIRGDFYKTGVAIALAKVEIANTPDFCPVALIIGNPKWV